VRDQVSHPYSTNGIITNYILKSLYCPLISTGHYSERDKKGTVSIRFIIRLHRDDISTNHGVKLLATGWKIGWSGFDFRLGLWIFLFDNVFRPALGPTQPPIQWVPRGLSLGVKRPGREADYSPPSSAEVKECVELYLHSPNTSSWRGA
jgi:hypothetical protein